MSRNIKLKYLLPTVAMLTACAGPSAVTDAVKQLEIPKHWVSKPLNNIASIGIDNWVNSFNHPQLSQLIRQAIDNNYSFKAQAAALAIAKERIIVADASDLPELSLTLNQSRRKTVETSGSSYSNSADINLKLSYELDLWGKLSDEQAKAQLTYASELAKYQQAELTLVADVTIAYFALVEAKSLLTLYQERARNLQSNLDMIQSSYRLGLTDALDVYLTQNNVSSELARVAEQQQQVSSKSRALELLLGEYPDADIASDVELMSLDTELVQGIPSDILTRRSDIMSSWYDLLATDASLAIAHKQRFPLISLTASTGDSSNELGNLLDGGAMAWSLIGNLTMPLFNAGRLASLEEQARLAVIQKEQLYLQEVYQAFSDVENNLANANSLKQRYEHYKKAKDNAISAEKISFDQYLKGLVTYTTVLESQRRAFDAQSTLIQLQNQLLSNRISLFVALGGSPFSETASLQSK
ncbi:efflux transporter outer membrane subunit [Thalassotalea profundi]|uniref:AdeC/adeK/oprM family multidrug efflux complex outer membrane factor n=1 Tax=Thalassotalea profundi TaxID=2036687 RepID=A0ABQ3IG34_9GAMM|nr:efflux transporter outer membrane subunit [Thalassotalea profundi]GHE83330.1 adeC/adeK/oprM family multidrug efflux complex outer membrane factor [Thalassotalea profundi]